MPRMLVPLGIAGVAAATLLYEVALTRVFSIAYGYHFAFLAMSLGLLGFGASGTALGLRRPRPLHPATLSRLAAAAAAALVLGYALANRIPFDPYRVGWEPGQLPLLGAYLLCYAVPFLLIGLTLGLPLTRWPERAAGIYAADLAGSAVGAVAGLVVLRGADAHVAVVVAAMTAALAALAFAVAAGADGEGVRAGRRPGIIAATAAATAVVLLVQAPAWLEIRLSPYKPLSQLLAPDEARLLAHRASAVARIDVVASPVIHSAPGLTLQYEGPLPEQTAAVLDGEVVLPLTARDGITRPFVEGLPTALAYELRPDARVLVLEPGGGLEVVTALELGAGSVTAVEPNPELAELLTTGAAPLVGDVWRDPRVDLVVGSPRAYVARTPERFGIVALPLAENRRTVTVGAFSLSETYALTADAFEGYLERLAPGGLLAVHRWLQLPPTEEIRAGALLAAALRRSGADPARSILAIRSFSTMLLLAKKEPFTPDEIARARSFARARQFDLVWHPGIQPHEANLANVLRRDRYHESFRALLTDERALFERYEYDVRPTTDDRPFFFHFFKWEQTPTIVALLGRTWQPFGGGGYLILVALLVLTTGLAAALVVVPAVVIRRRGGRRAPDGPRPPPMTYFAALGLGFLLVEVALVQQLVLVLDHSARSFAVVAFGLLALSGVGSLLSPRLPWRACLAVLTVLLAVLGPALPLVLPRLVDQPLPVRVAGALALLAPAGVLMGVGFPRGLTALGATAPGRLPLAWGVNGFTSVISAILAPMVALSFGFGTVLLCAAAAYALALVTARGERAVTAGGQAARTPRP